jgi:Mrp family chromosome partitioning ATPase
MKQLDDQYRSLRVTLEGAIEMPCVLAATSALAGDGSEEVACNLARAFAEASYRTAIVDAAGNVESLSAHLDVHIAPTQAFENIATSGVNGTIKNLKAIAIGDKCMPRMTSRPAIAALVSELKRNYDVVIVQNGPIPSDAAALQLSRIADGVLLAFRLGRRPSRSDKETLAMLERVRANVLGVVAIADEAERRPEPSPEAIPTTRIESRIAALDRSKEPMPAGR